MKALPFNLAYRPGTKLYAESGKQEVWTASMIDTVQSCKRLYYYKFIKKVVPVGSQSVDQVFGGYFAAGIERFYYYTLEASLPLEEALEQTVYDLLVGTADVHTLRNSTTPKNRRNLIAVLIHYIDTYAVHDLPHVKSTEQAFSLPITDDIIFEGRLDLLKKVNDVYSILDQKTTGGSIGPTYFKLWTPNNQMSMYLLAGTTLFPYPIKHIILDAVQITARKIDFARGIISRTTRQLEEWITGTTSVIKETRNLDPVEEQDWPQNPKACGYFRGCEYRDICSACPSIRHAYLEELNNETTR